MILSEYSYFRYLEEECPDREEVMTHKHVLEKLMQEVRPAAPWCVSKCSAVSHFISNIPQVPTNRIRPKLYFYWRLFNAFHILQGNEDKNCLLILYTDATLSIAQESGWSSRWTSQVSPRIP